MRILQPTDTKMIKRSFAKEGYRTIKIRKGKYSFAIEVIVCLPMMKHRRMIGGNIVGLSMKEIGMSLIRSHCTDDCPACERNRDAYRETIDIVNSLISAHPQYNKKIVVYLKEVDR